WQQVKQIFQSAIERPPDERDAFLARACQDNHALRSEVESLISFHDQAGDSIEAMAVEAATEMLANDRAIVGKQIGHYQVLSRIGRGGMGEVFLAQDTSLGRKVALKLLPADFTRNEERLRRFRQEARAASSLIIRISSPFTRLVKMTLCTSWPRNTWRERRYACTFLAHV
nr:hypothetical protein [Pyrinomonadaceae bacterium]